VNKLSKKTKKFDPKIVAYMCNWCGYEREDLEGMDSLRLSASIRIIRLMCSGRVHPALILDTLNHGSDGVLVCGCHEGNCHYISGNIKAEEGIKKVKKLLELLRIETDRVRLEWISPSERAKFSDIVKDFIEQLISLGPINIES